jgi:ABC-type phosphate transport system substrate-binding protein
MLAGLPTITRAQEVTGAGASFPAPIYAKWAEAYTKATGVRINYQSVGSGAGMRQIRGKRVDFGASDTHPSQSVAQDHQRFGQAHHSMVLRGRASQFSHGVRSSTGQGASQRL